jgi:hypothetical protein
MAITTYSPPSTALNPSTATQITSYFPSWSTTYNITAMSITNTTDYLVTFSANHNFVVGQTVLMYGGSVTGSRVNASVQVKTVPAANQITYWAAATPSLTYTSGGTMTGWISYPAPSSVETPGFAKYLGGYWFVADQLGNLFYSSDGINWFLTFPRTGSTGNNLSNNSGKALTDIAYDGSTWVVGDIYGNISSTTALNGNSTNWTVRVTGRTDGNTGLSRINKILWCGGTVNLFIAVGGSNAADVTTVLKTSPAGAATWTDRTSGQSTAGAINDIAFDGNSTVVYASGRYSSGVVNGTAGWGYSTNGTTWTFVTAGTNALYMACFYNAKDGRFYFSDNGYSYRISRATANLNTAWSEDYSSNQYTFPAFTQGNTYYLSSSSNGGNTVPRGLGPVMINERDGKIYGWAQGFGQSTLTITQYSSTTTVVPLYRAVSTAGNYSMYSFVPEGKYVYAIGEDQSRADSASKLSSIMVANNSNQFLVVNPNEATTYFGPKFTLITNAS